MKYFNKSLRNKLVPLLSLFLIFFQTVFPAVVVAETLLPDVEEVITVEENTVPEAEIAPTKDESLPKEEDLPVILPVWFQEGSTQVTTDPVVLGITYFAPQDASLTVTFTKLPEQASSLYIREITLTEEEISAVGAISETAYEIWTEMTDGTFEYDLTLPSTESADEVVYVEKRADLTDGAKEVTAEFGSEIVSVKGLDHMTIFVVRDSTPTIPAVPWPSEGMWNNYLNADGRVVNDYEDGLFGQNDDSNGGSNVTPEEIDIASCALFSGLNPGSCASLQYYYYNSGTCSTDYLFLRTRLAATPSVSGGSGAIYTSYHWDVLVDTNGDGASDYVVDVFGGKTSKALVGGDQGSLGIYPNNPGLTTYNPSNVAWIARADANENYYTRLLMEDYGDGSSTNNQYWLEIAVPLGATGIPSGLCGLSNLNGRIFASTSTSNTDPLQKDWMDATGFFTAQEESKTVANLTRPGAITESDPAKPGDVIEYTLTVENTGNRLIPGYQMIDEISDILEYAVLTDGDSDGNGRAGEAANGDISWSSVDIPIGATIIEKFTVTIKPSAEWPEDGDFVMENFFGKSTTVHIQKFGSISGHKYNDLDGDVTTVTDRTGVPGWTIELYKWVDNSYQKIDEILTSTGGYYEFGNLAPGEYRLEESLQVGWLKLSPVNNYLSVTLDPDEDDQNNDFVNVKYASAVVCKIDTDQNPINGWDVTVTDVTGLPMTLQTGEDGCAEFTDLIPGKYTVTEEQRSGWTSVGETEFSFDAESGGEYGPFTFENFEHATVTVTKDVLDPDGADISDDHEFIVRLNGEDPKIIAEGTNASYEITEPGMYTVSEVEEDGYENLGCYLIPDNEPATEFRASSGAHYDVLCTNRQVAASLTLTKVVVNDDGGTKTENDFNVYINTNSSTWGTHALNPGRYTVSEDSLPGYEASLWGGDCASDGSITLLPGDKKSCTITNDDIAPTLRLVKEVVNDHGGKAVPANWMLTASGDEKGFTDSGNSTTYHPVNAGVTYTLSESEVPGYEAGAWLCDGGLLDGDQLALAIDEDVTCTITNDDVQPRLTVTKVVVGGDLVVSDFDLRVGDVAVMSGVENGFDAGVYTVTEREHPDYYAEFSGDCGPDGTVELGLGDVKSCTITNTRRQGEITFIKDVLVGDALSSDWTFSVYDGAQLIGTYAHNETVAFDTGDYTVIENGSFSYFLERIGGTSCTQSVFSDTADLAVTENGGTCVFGNSRKATLTVTKLVDPSSSESFEITLYGGDLPDSRLFDDGHSEVFTDLMPGLYNLVETADPDYYTRISCDDVLGSGGVNAFMFDLEAGEDMYCTVVNTRKGEIIVEKQVLSERPGTEYSFRGELEGTLGDSEQLSKVVIPGTYSVSESPFARTDFELTDITCDDANSAGDISTGVTIFNVEPGEVVKCTYTNTVYGSIEGYKWEDLDADGVWDDGEPTVEGVKICIDLNSNGMCDSGEEYQSTGSDGKYIFDGLLPGAYTIAEDWTGWNQSYPGVGAGYKHVVELNAGESRMDVNFGNYIDASICVFKFNDINGDGQKQENEPYLNDWTMKVWADDDGNKVEVAEVTSGQCVNDLMPGAEYYVSEVMQAGWTQTLPGGDGFVGPFAASSEDSFEAVFGNFADAIVTACKYDTEGGSVAGWDISIDGQTKSTQANGCVDFTLTEAGDYIVSEESRAGWTAVGDTSYRFTAESGGEYGPYEFVNFEYAKVDVCKYNTEDEPIAGWDVTVGNETKATGADGCVEFTLTEDGEYEVTEEDRAGWTQKGETSYKFETESGGKYGPYNFVNFEDVDITVCKEDTSGNAIEDWRIGLARIGDATDYQSTSEDGCYTWTVTEPGEYRASESDPLGWTPQGPTTHNFTITSGMEPQSHTFVNFQEVDITVCKENTEGIPVEDWTVSLEGDDQLTGADGCYAWTVTKPGTYRATEDIRAGWTSQSSTIHDFVIESGMEPQSHTFVNFQNVGLTVCKEDTEGDRIAEWGLTMNDDEMVRTKENGCYTWEVTEPGIYTVREETKEGWTPQGSTVHDFRITSGLEPQSHTFVNFEHASITVFKDVVDPDGEDIDDEHEFTARLDGDDPRIISESKTATYLITEPGDYSVTEALDVRYINEGCYIDEGVLANDFAVESGGDYKVLCVNRQKIATLNLVKRVVTDNGGNEIDSDFSVYINDTLSSWGSHEVNPGEYNVKEDSLEGYRASAWGGDCSGDGSVTLLPGDMKTCAITNDDVAPTVTLVKVVMNENGGTAGPNDFGLSVGDTDVNSEETIEVNSNTDYAINEDGQAGYDFVSLTGEGCPSELGGTINLDEGENITCTITNVDLAPTLRLVKSVNNEWGGRGDPSDWILTASGDERGFSDTGDSETSHVVTAGVRYTLSESSMIGYEQVGWKCDGGEMEGNSLMLGLDEDVICTVRNNDIRPELEITKDASVGSIIAGSESPFEYMVKVQNVGNAPAFEVEFSDDVPKEFELDSFAIEPGAPTGLMCDAIGNLVKCKLEEFAIGEQFILTFIVYVPDDTAVDTYNNVAVVGTPYDEWSDDEDVDVYRRSVLQIDKTDDVQELIAGSSEDGYVEYTVEVVNEGPSTATNVVVWDDLPEELQYVSHISSENASCVYESSTHSIECEVGDLAVYVDDADDSDVVTFTVRMYAGSEVEAGTVYNYAYADADDCRRPLDDTVFEVAIIGTPGEELFPIERAYCVMDSEDTDIREVVDLVITKDSEPDQVNLGEEFVYEISIVNNGPSETENVVVADFVPEEFEILSVITDTGVCSIDAGNNYFKCDIGDMIVGAEASIEVEVKVRSDAEPGFYTNLAVAYSDEVEYVDDEEQDEILGLPVLTIWKSNTAMINGLTLAPGDPLTYMLNLTLSDAPMPEVTMIDVIPEGFTYVPGTLSCNVPMNNMLRVAALMSSYSIDNGVITVNLIDMEPGELVTCKYDATVDEDTPTGIYKDLAFASGESKGGLNIISNALTGDPSYISENMVGTYVPVEVPAEFVEEGAVLGTAVVRLPSTGPSVWILVIALIIGLMSVIGLVLFGRPEDASGKILMILPIMALMFSMTTKTAFASTVPELRVNEPAAVITKREVKISYTVASVTEASVVTCYYKAPGSTNFVQFGASKTFAAPIVGVGSCLADSSVITTDGVYEFKVVADWAGVDVEKTVSTEINSEAPETPESLEKEVTGTCTNRLRISVADDAQTTKVQIFRSTETSFTAAPSTLIDEVSVTPGEELVYDDPLPDCDEEYYYLARSVDEAGNVSPVVEDVIEEIEYIQEETEGTGAANNNTGTGGTENNGDTTDGEGDGTPEDEQNGEVLGEEEDDNGEATDPTVDGEDSTEEETDEEKSFIEKYRYALLLIVAVGIVAYGVFRGRK